MDRFSADPELLITRAQDLGRQSAHMKALAQRLGSIVDKAYAAVGGNEQDTVAEEFWRQWHPGAQNLATVLDTSEKLYSSTYDGVLSMATGLRRLESSNAEAAEKLRSQPGASGGPSHRG